MEREEEEEATDTQYETLSSSSLSLSVSLFNLQSNYCREDSTGTVDLRDIRWSVYESLLFTKWKKMPLC